MRKIHFNASTIQFLKHKHGVDRVIQMTKERKLGIQMWENIRRYIKRGKMRGCNSVRDSKQNFCKRKELNWSYDCWFCNYIKRCSRCPLKGCGDGSLFEMVIDPNGDITQRVEACDKIIAALKGEYDMQ